MDENLLLKLTAMIISTFVFFIINQILDCFKTAYNSTDSKSANNEYGSILAAHIANDVFPSQEALKILKTNLAKKYTIAENDFESTEKILTFAYCSFLSNQHISLQDKALFEKRFFRNKSHFILQDSVIPSKKWYHIRKKTIILEVLQIFLGSAFFLGFFILSFSINGDELKLDLLEVTLIVSLLMGILSSVAGNILGKLIFFLKPKI